MVLMVILPSLSPPEASPQTGSSFVPCDGTAPWASKFHAEGHRTVFLPFSSVAVVQLSPPRQHD